MANSWKEKAFRSRLLMRTPIWFYRAGLGFLFGSRLIMLEHVGRASGAARYVVLEVVARPSNRAVIVASALGRQAQWFQNIVAEPSCHVSFGFRRRVPAVAEILTAEEAHAHLADYQSRHPGVWKRLDELIATLHKDDKDFELPLIRLDFSPQL